MFDTGDTKTTERLTLATVIMIAIFVRALTGLSLYSGENAPPMFGDFECHRNWMETTYHYPVIEWYTNGAHMNMTYWPMDYPPLCAYTHWFMA